MLTYTATMSDAFAVRQVRNHARATRNHPDNGLQMLAADADIVLNNGLLDTFLSSSPSAMSPTSSSFADVDFILSTGGSAVASSAASAHRGVADPKVEAGFFAGMSHLALDFSSMLNPSKQILRLCSVAGRVFVICADYLPDHSIQPTEFGIQILLLSLAMKDFLALNNNNNNNRNENAQKLQ